jgi:hypothetical protein
VARELFDAKEELACKPANRDGPMIRINARTLAWGISARPNDLDRGLLAAASSPMALPPLFSLKKSCESPANPRNNQKLPILHEIGWIPMSSLVHCGIAGWPYGQLLGSAQVE